MKISVSEDEEHVAKIRTALKENGGYCPCRDKMSLSRVPRAIRTGNMPLWSLLQNTR